MSENNDKVVRAFPGAKLPENLMQIEPRNASVPFFCKHEAIRIDPHDRTIHCNGCGVALDAFDFVHKSAATMQTAWRNYDEVQRMVRELTERVDYLKKEENRLRAQVKRLKEKTEVVQVRSKSKL